MTSTRGDRRKMLRDQVLEVHHCPSQASTPDPARAVRSSISFSWGSTLGSLTGIPRAPHAHLRGRHHRSRPGRRAATPPRQCVEGRRRVGRARPAHAGRASEAQRVQLSGRAAWRLDVKALLRAGSV